MKYPIKKEFFPFTHFAAPVGSKRMAEIMGSAMRAPAWFFRDRELEVERKKIVSFDGGEFEILVASPRGAGELPAMLYFHGGGFIFGAAGYHYKLAKQYALNVPMKIIFVQYRLAPKNPFPIPPEDCYAALGWTYANAEQLGIRKDMIGVGGDSAGGSLAAAVCQMARDRGTDIPAFQMLVYPTTDRRMQTESNRKYTDTPMWNSTLSLKMTDFYVQDETLPDLKYASPAEAESFAELPPAYVETAEFDCLHDEGIEYAKLLEAAGTDVHINETKGTMHGFDIVQKAPTTRQAIADRIAWLREITR